MTAGDDYTEQEKLQLAELLLAGIKACGEDVDEAFARLDAMPPVKRWFAVQDYQLAGLLSRLDDLGLS